jgi:hypothetical protein
MNYIVPVISTIIMIIGIKKNKYLTLLGIGINVLVWPNIPHTHTEYIYYVLSSTVATLIGYYLSNIMN